MRPGILGGWRADLQGKQRDDSILKVRDIYTKTSHGQVQGFKVYLYDNPDPQSIYRPGKPVVEKEQGVTSVFLGIPYAQPPMNDGRFKVYMFLIFKTYIFDIYKNCIEYN